MQLKEFGKAIDQIAQEKAISKEQVVETIEAAIAAAYKKEYGKKGEIVRAKLDFASNSLSFKQIKTVVDLETVRIVEEGQEEEEQYSPAVDEAEKKPRYNPDRHMFVEEARAIKPEAQVADELEFPLETHEDFGRIAAQTAKQVIIQKLREAERHSMFEEYKGKEGSIISGIVQNFERGNVYVNLGKTTGVMFSNETIPTERYNTGQRLRFYVLGVQEEGRMPGVILSRAHPHFVEKLFELEVPEIAEGIVEVKAIAREPGNRTKIAVASKDDHIDPVGSCVGQRGSRVMAVINELGQEKIDIISWSENPEEFVGHSLSPAKTKSVEIHPRREALVYVADDQLSLAIGKGGQNVRLAAKLTGWKIDVRSQANPEQVQEGGVAASERIEIESEQPEQYVPPYEIEGVEPNVIKALMESGYKTIESLKEADVNELAKIEDMGKAAAKRIVEYVKNL